MAVETSEKAAWGLLGLALGAGAMYVLAKEDIYKPNPMEEDVEVLGETGDANALDEGGGVVYRHPQGHIVWEFWSEPEEGNASPLAGDPPFADRYTVYAVYLDDDEDIMDRYDWVDWEQIADYAGWDGVDQIRAMATSSNIMDRIRVLEDIASYHGGYELDQEPQRLTRAEMQERWPMFA